MTRIFSASQLSFSPGPYDDDNDDINSANEKSGPHDDDGTGSPDDSGFGPYDDDDGGEDQ